MVIYSHTGIHPVPLQLLTPAVAVPATMPTQFLHPSIHSMWLPAVIPSLSSHVQTRPLRVVSILLDICVSHADTRFSIISFGIRQLIQECLFNQLWHF